MNDFISHSVQRGVVIYKWWNISMVFSLISMIKNKISKIVSLFAWMMYPQKVVDKLLDCVYAYLIGKVNTN